MPRTALFALLLLAPGAHAAIYSVDTGSDAVLSACTEAIAADCSLRGAIDHANASAGSDTIQFAIPEDDASHVPESGHWRISAATALPLITDALVIDGFSQPGAAANTLPARGPILHTLKIELRGPDTSTDGLNAFAPLTVRGLALNNWRRAIFQFNPGPHVVEGNYIGTDISGLVALPNGTGVTLGGDVRVGGADPTQGNVIAANRDFGLNSQYALTRVRIHGNIIGATADLGAVAGRQDFGMYLLDPRDTLIGGATPAEGNVIVGSGFSAVSLSASTFQTVDGAPHARVQGNLIGIAPDGRAMGNGRSIPYPGILVGLGGYCRVLIGGEAPGEGNVIAHGSLSGVAIGSCWNAPILGNSFTGNRGIAIDLAGSNNFDGPTANDVDDADAGGSDPVQSPGGNRFQNFPTLTLPPDFIGSGGGTSVALSYLIDSAATHSAYPLTVHFYRGGCNGGGRELIASDTYGEADAQQPRNFLLASDANVLPLTVLAVDAAGNTSEFSAMLGETLFADGLELGPAGFSDGHCR